MEENMSNTAKCLKVSLACSDFNLLDGINALNL